MRWSTAILVSGLTIGLTAGAEARNCEAGQPLIVPVKKNPGVNEFGSITAAIKSTSPFVAPPNPPPHCILLYPDGANDFVIQESIRLGGTLGIRDNAENKLIFDVRIEVFQDETNTGKVIWQPPPSSGRIVLLEGGLPDAIPGLERPAVLTAEGVTFRMGGTLNPGGGAVFANKATFNCKDCRFEQNVAVCGGAVAAYGIIEGFDPGIGARGKVPGIPAKLDIDSSVFDTNVACQGGAVDVRAGAQAFIKNSHFVDNRSEAGSGLFVGAGTLRVQIPSQAEVSNSTFEGGISTIAGPPIPGNIDNLFCDTADANLDYGDTGICDYNIVNDRRQTDLAVDARAKSGGAIESHGIFRGDRLDIHDNTMAGPGGGVYVAGKANVHSFRLTNSFVTNNSGSAGDGIQFDFLPIPTLPPTPTLLPTNSPTNTRTPTSTPTITETPAGDTPTATETPTGPIVVPSDTPTVTATRTETSTATPTETPSPTATGPTPTVTPEILPLVVWNATIAGNDGEGMALAPAGYPDVANTIVWNNGDDLVGISGDLSNSIVQDTDDPVTGVIHQSPQFVDSQDYHLRGDTSAAFNAGDPAVLTAPTPLGVLDVDGDDRVIGAALDIGADELSTPRPSPTPTQGGPTLAAQPPGDSLGGIALVLAAMLLLVTQLRRLKPHA